MLTLAHARRVPCWPIALGFLHEGPTVGAYCRTCRQDVAMPAERTRETPECIYCALESGLLPLAELELGEPLADAARV